MGKNASIIKAYAKMLLDGTAFCNWKKKPDEFSRQKLVETIYYKFPKNNSLAFKSKIENAVNEAKNEIELNKMLSDMLIKEDEFLVK